ncbi:MAG: nucleotide sugar dehydrogenase [Deltaproteobacteria bacterium]|nr:nucleotide sugar dehydrogenase [Deltaproteobacteria bacterium]
MRIGVFGLGKLGLCSAACFAAKGHQVVGFDSNPEHLAALMAGACPIRETGLEELLALARPNFTVTDAPDAMVQETDFSFIIVPTPSRSDGRFENHAIEEVLAVIGPALRGKNDFHVVNIVSTVMPGSCEGSFQPVLERLSGKNCGTDFGLAYNPEFIALGAVIDNFLNPDLVLIGASDERTGRLLTGLYRSTCDNEPRLAVMSLINAEITKLSLNCFVTMKISFANELAAICEKIPGADAAVITAALGEDSRIGPKCLKSGLGFGGPCFPRDNLAFQAFAQEAGWEACLAPQVVRLNHLVTERLLSLISRHLNPPARVALLGLAYKPDTHIVEESQSLHLARKLMAAGFAVRLHDPLALDEARAVLGEGPAYCRNACDCLRQTDAVALLTNWPHYAGLDWERMHFPDGHHPLLVDCWGILKGRCLPNFRYFSLGLGPRHPVIGPPLLTGDNPKLTLIKPHREDGAAWGCRGISR